MRSFLSLLFLSVFSFIAHAQSGGRNFFGDKTTTANSITVNLPHIVVLGDLRGLAGGLGYERFIGNRGRLSLELPLYAASMSDHLFAEERRNGHYRDATSYYAAPGICYHPCGNGARADVSLGMHLLAGTVQIKDVHYDNITPVTDLKGSYLLTGLMGAVGVQFNSEKVRRVFGIYASGGAILTTGPLHGLMGQFGIKFGGRF